MDDVPVRDGLPAAAPPVLLLERARRTYPGATPVHALVDVDLAVWPGEHVVVVGPSGSGKSTLLHVLGCLDQLDGGRYLLDGIDTASLTDRQRTALRSRRIGFVFQSFHLLSHRTAVDNVAHALRYQRVARAERRERAVAALERVGLGHRLDHLPPRLSGGERQRVAIARALVVQPSILLADEPTGNLDQTTSEEVLALFAGLVDDGVTLLVITHDMAIAARAPRALAMVDGRLAEA